MEASIYRLRTQDVLVLCVLALLALGIVIVESASTNVAGAATISGGLRGWQWSLVGLKQLKFAGAAFATFLLVGHINYSHLARRGASVLKSPTTWAVVLAAICCLLVLAPGIGTSVNGARRWIKLGPVQLQPSELAKWAAVLFLAHRLTLSQLDLSRFFSGFVLTLIPVGLLCLLVVIQDFGTAALIALCAFTMLLAGRVRLSHVLIIIFPVAAAGVWFIMHKSYRMGRIMAFMDPYASPQGSGYHMIQSLLSFSSGGLLGRGLGNGIQKLGYLPEDTTDFIFSVICEELGLFGALLTVALYLGIVYVGWQVVKQKRDDFGRMLAFGCASMIGLQAVINIAVATVSVPPKGLSLPLVSAGGTGLIITCAAMGIFYSVTRHRPALEEQTDPAQTVAPTVASPEPTDSVEDPLEEEATPLILQPLS